MYFWVLHEQASTSLCNCLLDLFSREGVTIRVIGVEELVKKFGDGRFGIHRSNNNGGLGMGKDILIRMNWARR